MYFKISGSKSDRQFDCQWVEVISCGANVPFADKKFFFGSIMEEVDHKVSLIPDFISNCGMARVFAYFMEKKVQMTDETIFHDTSEIIKNAIEKTYALNPSNKYQRNCL